MNNPRVTGYGLRVARFVRNWKGQFKNTNNAIYFWMILLASYSILHLLVACQSNPYKHGEIMYQNFCMNCHMEDGTGLTGNIPPLAGADFLTTAAEQLPCIIRYGISDTIEVNGVFYTTPMEGIPQLTDVEITNIINYINHAWGNDNGFTKPTDVERYLKSCK